MKKILFLSVLFINLVFADFMSIRSGVGVWNAAILGDVGTVRTITDNGVDTITRDDNISLQDDLGISSYQSKYFWFEVEHPFPAVPNFGVLYTKLDYEGQKTLTRNIVFVQNNTFNIGEIVDYTVILDQFDFTAYWELVDSFLEIDLGVDVKYLSGEVRIAGQNANNDEVRTFREFFPMGYGRVKLIAPNTNMGLIAQGSTTFSSSSKISQYKAGALLEGYSIGGEIGYKKEIFDVEDLSSTFLSLEISGIYGALYLHF